MTDFSTDFFITRNDIRLIFPYLSILVFIGLSFFFRFAFGIKNAKIEAAVAIAGALLAGFFTYQLRNTSAVVFGGFLILDDSSRTLLFVLLLFFFLYVTSTIVLMKEEYRQGHYTLLLTMLFGMTLMASAGNLVVFFVGLEVSSASYIFLFRLRGTEPQITELKKIDFAIGITATVAMLAGIITIKVIAKTVDVFGIKEFFLVSEEPMREITVNVGLILTGIGMAIKTSAFTRFLRIIRTNRFKSKITPILVYMTLLISIAAFLYRVYSVVLTNNINAI